MTPCWWRCRRTPATGSRSATAAAVQASIELVLGEGWRLELTEASEQAPSGAGSARPRGVRGATPREPDPPQRSHRSGPLGNPKLTFEQFVIGDSNRLAHAAALTVAEMPAQAYNPLFICGPPGVGKTHLLSSIANLLTVHAPEMTVRATTGEAFTNEFLAALATGEADRFKARFRDVDVLLLDDVQFLQRKTRTEEEFFHTFNALHDEGRQIVLTSDRPPHDLQALEDRLRERFAAGLIADVAPPDLSTRLAILRKRAHHDDVRARRRARARGDRRTRPHQRAGAGGGAHPRGRLQLAERTAAHLRAGRRGARRPLPTDVAGGDPAPHDRRRSRRPPASCSASPRPSSCRAREPLVWPGRGRSPCTSHARSPGSPLPTIGRQFGGRDHTTVLHACKRASARISSDESSRQALQRLCTALGCEPPAAP